MTIYLDMYFLKNILFNFLLLYLTSLASRKKLKFIRGLIASSIGGIYAVIALFSLKIFDSVALKLATSVVMLIIAFGSKEISINLSCFFITNYLIAGIIASLLNVNSQIIILLFAIIMMSIFYIYKQNQKHNEYYNIYLQLFGKTIELIAKLDSGNELRDSIFGNPVIVVSKGKMKEIFGEELIKVLNKENEKISNKYKNKIRLITFNTIAGEGVKIGIKLDNLIVKNKTKFLTVNATMILSENIFKNYDALIGPSLLEGGFEYESDVINKIKNKGTI